MVSGSIFDDKIKVLEQWIKTHEYLPIKIDAVVLKRYLHSVHSDVDLTKKLIEHSYSLRNKYPNIFCNRDPLSADVQKIFQVADLGIPMPSLTEENYRIILNRLIDHDAEKFDFENVIKAFFLVADHRFSTPDEKLPLQVNDGELPIFDMTGFSYRHLTKLSLSTLKCYMKFTQEAFPVRLKQVHLINVSPVLKNVLMILRPFMKSNVRQLLNFHAPGSTTLYDHISQELLPSELGGKAGSVDEIKSQFLKQLITQRDYLTDDAYWKPRDVNNNQMYNKKLEDNLRSLSID